MIFSNKIIFKPLMNSRVVFLTWAIVLLTPSKYQVPWALSARRTKNKWQVVMCRVLLDIETLFRKFVFDGYVYIITLCSKVAWDDFSFYFPYFSETYSTAHISLEKRYWLRTNVKTILNDAQIISKRRQNRTQQRPNNVQMIAKTTRKRCSNDTLTIPKWHSSDTRKIHLRYQTKIIATT